MSPAEMPWPPRTIRAWLRNEMVDTIRLREELRYWADWAEKTDDEAASAIYKELS